MEPIGANLGDTDVLVSQAAGGDTEAVATLMDRYRGRLKRMVGLRLDRRLRQGLNLRQHGGQPGFSRPVDDQTHGPVGAVVEQQDNGLREVGISEVATGDQKPPCGQLGLERYTACQR